MKVSPFSTPLWTDGAAGPTRYCKVTLIYHKTWKCNCMYLHIFHPTNLIIRHKCTVYSPRHIRVSHTSSSSAVMDGTKLNEFKFKNVNRVKWTIDFRIHLAKMETLKSHKEAMHENEQFICTDCGASLESVKQLNSHKRKHKSFLCDKCNRSISQNNKQRHQKLSSKY